MGKEGSEARRGLYRFPREERLKKRKDIGAVFDERKALSCGGARLLWRPNGLLFNRIAFTFNRKFGNAVERNRSRRLSREVYRLLRNELKKGYDLVLLVYPGGDAFSTRMEQMRDLFSRAGMLEKESSQ